MRSSVQRSLKVLREEYAFVEKVETFNPYARKRRDLFGFGDILCIDPKKKPLLVQVRTRSIYPVDRELVRKLGKIKGMDFVYHIWSKRKRKWHLRVVSIGELRNGNPEGSRRF
jgi:hypothetical protein